MTVREVLQQLEILAPKRYAYGFDKVGLQVGNLEQQVTKAVVALDRSLGAVDFCCKSGAQLLLCHHPLIFRPIESVDSRSHVGRTILKLVSNDIAFAAAHTNWDSARGGVNDTLASLIGLQDVKPFGSAAEVENLKLVFFCPPSEVEGVIDAVSEAGAGVIGAYRRCAFKASGQGTFIGGEGSNPAVGESGRIENVDEIRVEMILPRTLAGPVTRALRKSHPYEEPAYDLMIMTPAEEQPIGRIGSIGGCSLAELARSLESRLATKVWAWGDPAKSVKKVAVCGGGADDEWMNAQRAGADVLVTGEVKQHVALEASESGMCLIAAGHYATEHPGCAALRDRMAEAVPAVAWLLFEPPAGFHGRPMA